MEKNSQSSLPSFKFIGLTAAIVVVIVGSIIAIVSNRVSQEQKNAPPPVSTVEVDNLVPTNKESKPISGQITVQAKSTVTEAQLNQFLQGFQGKVKSKIDSLNTYVVEVPSGEEETVVEKLFESGLIQNAEQDSEVHINFKPNDPLYSSQWGFSNSGQSIRNITGIAGADSKIEQAWDVTKGDNIKVGVVDTGINLNHPDLAGQIISQRVFITQSIEDLQGHGTHVAGMVAANGNNGQGITGVCPGCKLIIAKALDDTGSGASSGLAAALTWAVDEGAQVVNISAGGDKITQVMQSAIEYAKSKGVIVVSSAGNNGDTVKTYPGSYDGVVSVAAIDNRDLLASFSTRGTWVQVAAPGVNILSTTPTHPFNLQKNGVPETTNGFLSGTSMASPIVTGIMALILSSPYGTSDTAAIQRLYATTDKIAGTGTYWAHGRVNAARAVGADAITPTAAPTEAASISPTDTVLPTPTIIAANPTQTVAIPTFTCLGACITPEPTPAPSPTPKLVSSTQSAINLQNLLQSIFKSSNCPYNPSGLVSTFSYRGGGGDRGGNRDYNRGGNRNDNRGGDWNRGGGKGWDGKNGYRRPSRPSTQPAQPTQPNNCQRTALLQQILLLFSKLLPILFGPPQPGPVTSPPITGIPTTTTSSCPAVITKISPTSGPVGTEVTITGSGFISYETGVRFGDAEASILSNSETVLIVTAPENTGTVPVKVSYRASDGAPTCISQQNFSFTYIIEPTPTEIPIPTDEPIPTIEPNPTEEPLPTDEPVPTVEP